MIVNMKMKLLETPAVKAEGTRMARVTVFGKEVGREANFEVPVRASCEFALPVDTLVAQQSKVGDILIVLVEFLRISTKSDTSGLPCVLGRLLHLWRSDHE